jgi:hypothetical protein
MYSSMSLGLVPAASMRVGEPMSVGMNNSRRLRLSARLERANRMAPFCER